MRITASIFQRTIIIPFILFVIIGRPVAGNCGETNSVDDITVQGTEVITYLSEKIDTCIIELGKGEPNTVKLLIGQAMDLWNVFTEKERQIFTGEMEKSEQIENIIVDITADLSQIFNYIRTEETARATTLLQETKQHLENLLSTIQQPILIAFIGPRCTSWPDCRTGVIMRERVNNIAFEFNGSARFVFIDVKKNKEFARIYNILFVPTLVFIDRYGKEVSRKVGEMDEISIRMVLLDLMEGN